MLGKFVTAKLFGKNDCRKGWVISVIPLIIQGELGIHYHCSGTSVLVVNPHPNPPLEPTREGRAKNKD